MKHCEKCKQDIPEKEWQLHEFLDLQRQALTSSVMPNIAAELLMANILSIMRSEECGFEEAMQSYFFWYGRLQERIAEKRKALVG